MNWDGTVSMSDDILAWYRSVQEYSSNVTVCQVNHRGLVLFEILEGAASFLCDVISWWLGLLKLVVTALLIFLAHSTSIALTSD